MDNSSTHKQTPSYENLLKELKNNTSVHNYDTPSYLNLLKKIENLSNNSDSDASCLMISPNGSLQDKQISLSCITIPSICMLNTSETNDRNEACCIVNKNSDSRSSILVMTTESILCLLQSEKTRILTNNANNHKLSYRRKSAAEYVPDMYKSEKKRNHLKCKCIPSRHRVANCRLVVLCEIQDDSDTVSCDLDDNVVINSQMSCSSVSVKSEELRSDHFAYGAEFNSENFLKESLSATNTLKNKDDITYVSKKYYKRMFKGKNDVGNTFSDTNVNKHQMLPSDKHTVTPDSSSDNRDNGGKINKPTKHDKVLRENHKGENIRNHLKCKCIPSRYQLTNCRLIVLCENQDDSDINCTVDDNVIMNSLISYSCESVGSEELTLDDNSENFLKKSLPATNTPKTSDIKTKGYKRAFKGKNDIDDTFSNNNLNEQQKLPSDRHTTTPDNMQYDNRDNTWQINKPAEHDKVLRENPQTKTKLLEDDVKKRKLDSDYIEGSKGCDDRVHLQYLGESTGNRVFVDIYPDQKGCGSKPPGAPKVVVEHQPAVRPPDQPTMRLPGEIYQHSVKRPPPGGIYQPTERPPGGIYWPSKRPPSGGIYQSPVRIYETRRRSPRRGHPPLVRPRPVDVDWTYPGFKRGLNPQMPEHLTNELQQTESSKPVKGSIVSEENPNTSDINKRKLDVDYIEGSKGCDDHVHLQYLAENTGDRVFVDIYPDQKGCGKQPGVPPVVVDYQPAVRPPEQTSVRPPGGIYQPPERSPGGIYQPPRREPPGGIYQPPERSPGGIYQPPRREPPGGIYQPPVRIYETGRRPPTGGHPPLVRQPPVSQQPPMRLHPSGFKRALIPQTSKHRVNKLHQTDSQMNNCKLETQNYDFLLPVLKEAKNKPILKLLRSENVHAVYGKSRDKKSIVTYPVFLSIVDKDDMKCGCVKKE